MKEIPITQGKVVIVDDADYEWLSQWKWQYGKAGGYAVRHESRSVGHGMILMHRLIMQASADVDVDHINGNGLDNRRANLRTCSHQQNMWNAKRSKLNTSGFTGVYWSKAARKWQAYIRHGDKTLYLGLFELAEDAARARDAKAIELRGEFARTNF